MNENWKKYLLKSGLPFEYEVKECFIQQKCTVWDEYSYLKMDENNIEKEFSYDIDACYWTLRDYSFNFMVECKYKTEPTAWFFMPDPLSYQNEVNANSFFHPVDYFTKESFIFSHTPYCNIQEPLGPFCLKGIEVYQNQFVELNIFKAINQLSYAFVEKLIECFNCQLSTDTDLYSKTIFFNIPIIITNAELRLINEKLTTVDIENCDDIDKISTKHDFLFFDHKIGEKLRYYNHASLTNFFAEISEDQFNLKNNSFTKDLSHFINVLSQHYCPKIILIMHHDEMHENYKKLFDYINFMVKPSQELKEKVRKLSNEYSANIKKIQKEYGLPKRKKDNNLILPNNIEP